jgi:glycerol-3-phosphate dehydrogenase
LRYLEHGWLKLVFEASRERRTLLRIAPHLVTPRSFVFPVFKGSRVARWEISAGVLLYDLLALFRNAGRHRWLSRGGVLRREPLLRDQDLTGGALYWDAQCDDARLTIATLRSARRHGARIASYARCVQLEKAGGRVRGAQVADALAGTELTVRAHVVINATGPWSDALRALDDPARKPLLRTTRGTHIAVPRARIGNEGAITMTSPLDGRVMFVLPHSETTIVGTTDTDTRESPDDVGATPDDVIYLVRSANAAFPNARLGVPDVIAAWSGLRPLLDQGDRPAAAVPREHHIEESGSGLISVLGGKLTTYRAMADEIVDLAAARLRSLDGRQIPAGAATAREPLPGGDVADLTALAGELAKEGLDGPTADHLAGKYGSEAPSIASLIRAEPALAEPLIPGKRWIAAEVVHHARREMALSVEDVLVRRLHVFHEVRGHGAQAAAATASLLARELGWPAEQAAASVAEYRDAAHRLDGAISQAS